MVPPDEHSTGSTDSESAQASALRLTPIGIVRSPYTHHPGTPRQATRDLADGRPAEGRIELAPGMQNTLRELNSFSHVWVLYWMHHAAGKWNEQVRAPRDGIKRGVFATRAPHRPNPIGLSAVRLLEVRGTVLHVRGLDILDGSPVLDLKPYLPYADRIDGADGGWTDELDLDQGPDHRDTRVVGRRWWRGMEHARAERNSDGDTDSGRTSGPAEGTENDGTERKTDPPTGLAFSTPSSSSRPMSIASSSPGTPVPASDSRSDGDSLATPGPSRGAAIVVGASSGIGEALALQLGAEKRPIALVARRVDKLEELARRIESEHPKSPTKVFALDVADLDAAEKTFAEIEEQLGPVDELHYVAGVMPEVALDEYDTDKDALQFQVNTLGCIAWCNAAARRFEKRGRGRIIGITSVAGDRGRRGRPAYCASKAGQDAYLEALRNRLWQHGVRVTTVRPGFVTTPMTEHLELKGAISAEQAAKLTLRARDRERSISYIPFKWWPIMTVIKAIPSFVFRRLSI